MRPLTILLILAMIPFWDPGSASAQPPDSPAPDSPAPATTPDRQPSNPDAGDPPKTSPTDPTKPANPPTRPGQDPASPTRPNQPRTPPPTPPTRSPFFPDPRAPSVLEARDLVSRSARRRGRRLSRSPDMFGDLFGSTASTLSDIEENTGVTDGTTGLATFFEATLVSSSPTFVLSHPGNVPRLDIDLPGLFTRSGTNEVFLVVDTRDSGSFLPKTATVAESTLVAVDNSLNTSQFITPLTATVIPIERARFGANSTVSVVLVSQNPLTLNDNPELFFPIVVDTLVSTPLRFSVPSPSTGGAVVGRLKIAENASPLPRDRVFVGYSYFDNVPLVDGGVNVHRAAPGFEKTFFDGNASLRFRLPVASTLSSNVDLDGTPAENHGEVGNLFLDYKQLLDIGENHAVSCGLGLTLPTADDLAIRLFGRDFIRAENRGIHLLPYVAGIANLSDRWFVQGFLQLDFDLNGNPVLVDGDGRGLVEAGRLQDPTFLFADIACGYWIFDRPDSDHWFRGLVGTTELHYNRSLQSGDTLTFESLELGDFSQNTEVLNAVFGATAMIGDDSTLGVAYVTPLGGSDQQFDGELRVTFNYFFGPTRERRRPLR